MQVNDLSLVAIYRLHVRCILVRILAPEGGRDAREGMTERVLSAEQLHHR